MVRKISNPYPASEYDGHSLGFGFPAFIDLKCKTLDDFINFLQNAIEMPRKSQKEYVITVSYINGECWFRTNNPWLDDHNVVGYKSDDPEADMKTIMKHVRGKVRFISC